MGALVRIIEDNETVVELVNLSPFEERSVIIQGGTFGEHVWGRVTYDKRTDADPIQPDFFARLKAQVRQDTVEVGHKFFQVRLPPATGITLEMETRRYAGRPSYAFPWHE